MGNKVSSLSKQMQSHKRGSPSSFIERHPNIDEVSYPAPPYLISKLGTSSTGLFCMSNHTSRTPGTGVDVIALHTLGGTALGSWHRSRPSNTKPQRPCNPSNIPLSAPSMWLRDMLAPDLADCGARVMAYGYCTDPGSGGVKTTRLVDGREMHVVDIDCIAEDILCNVAAARAWGSEVASLEKGDDGSGLRRPLVFIAHGLGGLVLKKALLLCRAAPKGSERREILESTVHVVFLSTPHDPTDKRLPARWSDVVFASGVDVSIPSHEWAVVTKEFQALGEKQEISFTVTNLVEKMGIVSVFGTSILTITTGDVARLGWGDDREEILMVRGRNHLTLLDIYDYRDPAYGFIKRSIRERLMVG